MSKAEQIKQYFLDGGVLTVKSALLKFGTTELRRVVSRLRKQGMDIASEKINHLYEKGYHKEYFLTREGI